jgi:hypothetical protein
MLALANEVEQINYNVISEGISEFVKRLELFEWFEGLFINMSKATGFVVNLVYDGCKLDKQLFGFISALFAIISYESGISISLNKVDINSYADPDLHMYDIFGLKTGKIIKDNNGKINNLKSMLNNYDDCEEQEDMCSGIQYIK